MNMSRKGLFNYLSSNPATIEAAKAVDMYGLIQGHIIDIADVVRAYIQAKLGTTVKDKEGYILQVKTWVRLPPEYAPESLNTMNDPVVKLVLALHGHPDSGGGGTMT